VVAVIHGAQHSPLKVGVRESGHAQFLPVAGDRVPDEEVLGWEGVEQHAAVAAIERPIGAAVERRRG
jgi:hypothetical protein